MSFDRRDIRISMDVYTSDNVYLGTVLRIAAGSAEPAVEAAGPPDVASSMVNGELLGPMPTQPIGNPGPRTQAAATSFGSLQHRSEALGAGVMVVGKWWGLIQRRVISLELVQTVSLERIILKPRRADLS